MRGARYRAALVLALACVVAGVLVALTGRSSDPGPDVVVRDYFAALARADAPGALAYGNLPAGQHDFLTSEVLAEQQRIAPMRDVRITGVAEHGSSAAVGFAYRLDLEHAPQTVTGTISLARSGSAWHLVQTALLTRVILGQSVDRLSFGGSTVPAGRVLLFPGALPVRFDTPLLQLDPAAAAVGFGSPSVLHLAVQPTATARRLLLAGLATLVQSCLDGARAPVSCPLPAPGTVPGSVHGRILGRLADQVSFSVTSAAGGVIAMTGSLAVSVRYRALDFENVPSTQGGRTVLPIDAVAVAVAPPDVRFAE